MNHRLPVRTLHLEVVTRRADLCQRVLRLRLPVYALLLASDSKAGANFVGKAFWNGHDLYVRVTATTTKTTDFPENGNGVVCFVALAQSGLILFNFGYDVDSVVSWN